MKEKRVEKVRINKSQAEKIYNTGGLINVWYTYIDSEGRDIPKESKFRFLDCKLSFKAIQDIYKVSCVKDVVYYTDASSFEANAMCELMCN